MIFPEDVVNSLEQVVGATLRAIPNDESPLNSEPDSPTAPTYWQVFAVNPKTQTGGHLVAWILNEHYKGSIASTLHGQPYATLEQSILELNGPRRRIISKESINSLTHELAELTNNRVYWTTYVTGQEVTPVQALQ